MYPFEVCCIVGGLVGSGWKGLLFRGLKYAHAGTCLVQAEGRAYTGGLLFIGVRVTLGCPRVPRKWLYTWVATRP